MTTYTETEARALAVIHRAERDIQHARKVARSQPKGSNAERVWLELIEAIEKDQSDLLELNPGLVSRWLKRVEMETEAYS